MSSDTTGVPQDFRDFVIWERESLDTIDLKTIYIDMAGDLKAGIMLSQMVYWRLPRKNRSEEDTRLTIKRDGRLWLAKSDSEWWKEIRLTEKEARSARMVLEQRGLASFATWKFAGRPCTHITINEDRFMELWHQMLATPIEQRQAGRVEPKVKREGAKKPGSKPRSGNWRKNTPPVAEEQAQADAETEQPQDTSPAEQAPLRENRLYEKGNLDFTLLVKSTLPKGQSPLCEKGKMNFTQMGTSYTETPAEIPPKIPSETPAVHSSSLELDEEAPLWNDEELSKNEELLGEGFNPLEAGEGLPSHSPVDQPTGGYGGTTATGTKNVPAAGGAARLAIPQLQAVPIDELECRPERDPKTMQGLRALMRATHESRLEHLQKELAAITRSGLSRQWLLRLTDDEIDQATKAAQHDAKHVKGGMSNTGYFALEAMIGEPFSEARLLGQEKTTNVVAEGQNLKAVAERQQELETLPSVEVGSQWLGRKSGKLYTVAENLHGLIVVEGLKGEYGLERFHANFVPAPAEASA